MLRSISTRIFKGSALWAGLILTLALLAPAPAQAQLQLALNNPFRVTIPGRLLTFTGTLTNPGATPIFLNGSTYNLTGTGLTLDDSSFLANAPLSLNGGESYTGEFFTILVGVNAPSQIAPGSFIVLGGTTDSAQNTVATQNIQVTVGAPEPGTQVLCLLGAGVALFSAGRFRFRISK